MKLVFVHLGAAKADHLWLNIDRLQKIFPELQYCLVYNDESFIEGKNLGNLEVYKYRATKENEELFNTLEHNVNFRQGFWRYSFERLLALTDYVIEHSGEKILHIESDILLMPNFPFDKIYANNKMSWCKFNETHDVASIMYIPNRIEAQWLTEKLRQNLFLDPSLTDMTVLRKISIAHPERVQYFNDDNAARNYGGIFDAAAMGMWLTGRDPRNHLGWIRRFLPLPESGEIFTRKSFRYISGDLLLSSNNTSVFSVYNLHVHSKRKSLFGNLWRVSLKIDVYSSRLGFPSYWFSPKKFWAIIEDNYRRHGGLKISGLLSNLRIKN